MDVTKTEQIMLKALKRQKPWKRLKFVVRELSNTMFKLAEVRHLAFDLQFEVEEMKKTIKKMMAEKN